MSLKHFTNEYIRAALWSSNDESDEGGGEPLDKNYDARDIAPETLRQMELDCANFYETFEAILLEPDTVSHASGDPDAQGGHDFLLTRNRHGVGFWDGDWSPESVADRLTAAAEAFGQFDLYVGDDGQIHGSPLSDEARSAAVAGLGAARGPRGEVDEAVATELQLYIDNDGDLYRQQTQSIHANLEKKITAGKYDPAKAPKLWRYLVDNGARKYAKEFASPGGWSSMFNVPTRDLVAQRMADEWYAEYQVQHGRGAGIHGLGYGGHADGDVDARQYELGREDATRELKNVRWSDEDIREYLASTRSRGGAYQRGYNEVMRARLARGAGVGDTSLHDSDGFGRGLGMWSPRR